MKIVSTGNTFRVYDDKPIECEEDGSEESTNKQPRQINPRVVKVIFKRKSSYSNIHYMVD